MLKSWKEEINEKIDILNEKISELLDYPSSTLANILVDILDDELYYLYALWLKIDDNPQEENMKLYKAVDIYSKKVTEFLNKHNLTGVERKMFTLNFFRKIKNIKDTKLIYFYISEIDQLLKEKK